MNATKLKKLLEESIKNHKESQALVSLLDSLEKKMGIIVKKIKENKHEQSEQE